MLANNAGFYLSGFLEDLPLGEVRGQSETNEFGLLRMPQLVLPAMREQGAGRIINVRSIGGIVTSPGGGAYPSSKFALEALSDVLRMEVREFGTDVVIATAGVATPLWSNIPATYPGTGPDSPYAHRIERHRRSVTEMFGDDNGFLVLPPRTGRTHDPDRPPPPARTSARLTLMRSLPEGPWPRPMAVLAQGPGERLAVPGSADRYWLGHGQRPQDRATRRL